MSAGHFKAYKSSIPVKKTQQNCQDSKSTKSASGLTALGTNNNVNDVEVDPKVRNQNFNLNARNSDSLVSSTEGINEAPRSNTALSTSSDSSSSSVTTSASNNQNHDSDFAKLKSQSKNQSQLQASRVNNKHRKITQNGTKAKTTTAVTASNSSSTSAEVWLDEKGASLSQRLKNDSMADSERRRDEMEKQIKELEAQLTSMTVLIEKREKLMQDTNEEAKQKQEDLQGLLNDQETLLMSHGIDPATGERVCSDEGTIETNKKFTKKRVQEMREKLKQMSEKTQSCLSDVEKTLSDITELEQASERARPSSPGTCEILEELARSNEIFKLDVEISQQQLQTRDINDDIDDYTKGKFGLQFFITDASKDDTDLA